MKDFERDPVVLRDGVTHVVGQDLSSLLLRSGLGVAEQRVVAARMPAIMATSRAKLSCGTNALSYMSQGSLPGLCLHPGDQQLNKGGWTIGAFMGLPNLPQERGF